MMDGLYRDLALESLEFGRDVDPETGLIVNDPECAVNLLPIPGLDGSRLVFGVIEAIRGKPVPPQKEAVVHLVGMGLLLVLMVFFTFRDVMRLFR